MVKRLASITHTWLLYRVIPGALTAFSIQDGQSSTLKPHPPQTVALLGKASLYFCVTH